MSIPITPRRTEPLLLPKLRTLFPDVTFDTIERADLEPPFTEATLADSMQGMSTPISQYVRLRVSVRCMKEDHTGDWDKAARVWRHVVFGCVSVDGDLEQEHAVRAHQPLVLVRHAYRPGFQ